MPFRSRPLRQNQHSHGSSRSVKLERRFGLELDTSQIKGLSNGYEPQIEYISQVNVFNLVFVINFPKGFLLSEPLSGNLFKTRRTFIYSFASTSPKTSKAKTKNND
jgi:hypothetical protein